MKIIYIHQYFKTPQEGGAIRSYYIAKSFVDAGHEVELITTHNSSKVFKREVEGIKVHYLPVTYHNKFGFFRRMAAFIKFTAKAIRYASGINADICYATSTPLSVGIVALWLKWKKGLPYYFEVRDLWPEAPVKLGFLKSKLMVYLSYQLEKRIYHKAEKIVCLSPGIENNIKKRYLYLETLRVPNMSDCVFYFPEEKSGKTMLKYDVSDTDVVIAYSGAIGRVNHLEYLLEAAKACQEMSLPIKFFIAGNGSEKPRLERLSGDLGLKNTFFLGHLNRYEIKELLNISDAVYISFMKNEILETNSPNKFFDALAAGKMVLTNTKGWIKELVDEHECGLYVNPENPIELPKKILSFLKDRSLFESYGLRARNLAQDQFLKENLTKIIVDELNSWSKAQDQPAQSIGL